MDATDLDDPMQTCPYDESHRILKSRMQWHLVRCRKNHPANKDHLRTCPFDVLHVVNSIEYEYHVANCPKSGSVLNFMYSSEGQRCVGSVSLEESNNAFVPPPTENWDADPPAPKYDPLHHAQNREVFIPTVGLSKAKKRQFKNSERLRFQALEEKSEDTKRLPKSRVEEEDFDKPLREPRNTSKAFSLKAKSKEDLSKQEDLTPTEVSLRPPRTKSVALSVCSSTDYTEDILNISKVSTSTRIADCLVSTPDRDCSVSTPDTENTSSAIADSAALFNSILVEAAKKTDQVVNQTATYSTQQQNGALEEAAALNGEENSPERLDFLLANLATSSSDSNSINNVASTSSTDISSAQSSIQAIVNPTHEVIMEITTRLATLSTLEQSLDREKAKLKQQVDQYFASRGNSRLKPNNHCDSTINPRCAANFSKAKQDPPSPKE